MKKATYCNKDFYVKKKIKKTYPHGSSCVCDGRSASWVIKRMCCLAAKSLFWGPNAPLLHLFLSCHSSILFFFFLIYFLFFIYIDILHIYIFILIYYFPTKQFVTKNFNLRHLCYPIFSVHKMSTKDWR